METCISFFCHFHRHKIFTRWQNELDVGCRNVLALVLADASRDYRLDYHLLTECAVDIDKLCDFQKKNLHDIESKEGHVIHCLREHQDQISRPGCRKAVSRGIALSSQDFRINSDLSRFCLKDRQTLCKDVPPVCCCSLTSLTLPPALWLTGSCWACRDVEHFFQPGQ
jgi:hypothetical protein